MSRLNEPLVFLVVLGVAILFLTKPVDEFDSERTVYRSKTIAGTLDFEEEEIFLVISNYNPHKIQLKSILIDDELCNSPELPIILNLGQKTRVSCEGIPVELVRKEAYNIIISYTDLRVNGDFTEKVPQVAGMYDRVIDEGNLVYEFNISVN